MTKRPLVEEVRDAINNARVFAVRRDKSNDHQNQYEVFDCHEMWENDNSVVIRTFATHVQAQEFSDTITDFSIAQAAIDTIKRWNGGGVG